MSCALEADFKVNNTIFQHLFKKNRLPHRENNSFEISAIQHLYNCEYLSYFLTVRLALSRFRYGDDIVFVVFACQTSF